MQLSTRYEVAFLSNTKCASTSIESALSGICNVNFSGHSLLKHMNARVFNRYIRPLHKELLPNVNIESFCLMREPIAWVGSWYRYRSRPEIADPNSPNHANYAGGISFDEFVEEYLKPGTRALYASLPTQFEFIQGEDGGIGVDYLFDSSRMDLVLEFMRDKFDPAIQLPQENVSPKKKMSLSADNERKLRAHLAKDIEIYAELSKHGVIKTANQNS